MHWIWVLTMMTHHAQSLFFLLQKLESSSMSSGSLAHLRRYCCFLISFGRWNS